MAVLSVRVVLSASNVQPVQVVVRVKNEIFPRLASVVLLTGYRGFVNYLGRDVSERVGGGVKEWKRAVRCQSRKIDWVFGGVEQT